MIRKVPLDLIFPGSLLRPFKFHITFSLISVISQASR